MDDRRSVEHYRDHELVYEAHPATHGWYYTLSVVSHHGDSSEARTERSPPRYASDLDALRAAHARGRAIVDEQLAGGAAPGGAQG
jgi:hypothetical protein